MNDIPDTYATPFKMGRKRPAVRKPRLHLSRFFSSQVVLPDPPASVDYTQCCKPMLAQVLGNDVLSDCTAAGALHIAGSLIINAGGTVLWVDEDYIAFYSASTGYIRGDEKTDLGGNEQSVLNYWKKNGLLPDGSHKIAGFMSVNPRDIVEIKQAIYLFGNVYFGVEMPDAWIKPFPASDGFVWDVAGKPNDANGHCFVGLGYNDVGIIIDTWGMLGIITWAAVEEYCANSVGGELWTCISKDSIAAGSAKNPDGMKWDAMVADFAALGGSVQA